MKLLITLFMTVISVHLLNAQDTIYYDINLQPLSRNSQKSTYYSFHNGKKVGNFYRHNFYYLDGSLYQTCFTKSQKEKSPKEGQFQSFYPSGNVLEEGMYVKGKKYLKWAKFFENGQPALVYSINYDDKKEDNGWIEYHRVWDKEGNETVKNGKGNAKLYNAQGQLIEEGKITQLKKNGLWVGYYPNGQKKYEETYKKGILQQGTFWELTGESEVYDDLAFIKNKSIQSENKKYYTKYFNEVPVYHEHVFCYSTVNKEKAGKLTKNEFFYLDGTVYTLFYSIENTFEGQYRMYYPSGQLKVEGLYEKGKKVNIWKRYYPNGQIYQEYSMNYKDYKVRFHNVWEASGVQTVKAGEGHVKLINDDGVLYEEGDVSKKNKHGVWTGYYGNGDKYFVEKYDNGKFLTGESWDEKGKHYLYDQLYALPSPKITMKGFYKRIGQVMKYPYIAKMKNIQGKVYVEISISYAGVMTNARIKKGIHPSLDQAVLRTIKEINEDIEWYPGMKKGIIESESKIVLPVSFKLGGHVN
ncbi:energy transducer TonB [Flammeovirga sp. SubArs3]|uniref:energy transducer TonB n=1 Tax=Flammeovirga sp. SubArs3 TaxID=2995316 RepID=UPI00248BECAD|nr:energy transducer TonB [Flammeovirga sp. SubArs3]